MKIGKSVLVKRKQKEAPNQKKQQKPKGN